MNVTVVKDIVYTPADWPQQLMADIYKPEGSGPFPGVVMIHGGGWKGRTRGDMVRYSKAVAQRGYVVMNVSYRFAPQWNFPAQLKDMTQAVLWFRTNAAAHNVQPDRIAAWGYSAGAHLAALVGVTGPGDSQYVEGARVQAIVAGGTPVDLRYYKRGPLTNGLMGVPHDENPDLWRDASPVALVTSDDPPTFLYHGSLDFTVGSKNADAMSVRGAAAEAMPAENKNNKAAQVTPGFDLIDVSKAVQPRKLQNFSTESRALLEASVECDALADVEASNCPGAKRPSSPSPPWNGGEGRGEEVPDSSRRR
jgi:acetyl esterase/lipase